MNFTIKDTDELDLLRARISDITGKKTSRAQAIDGAIRVAALITRIIHTGGEVLLISDGVEQRLQIE